MRKGRALVLVGLLLGVAGCTALLGTFDVAPQSGGPDAGGDGAADGSPGPDGATDGSGGDGGGEGGTYTCDFATKLERVLAPPQDAGSSVEQIDTYFTSQSNTLAIMRASTDPSFAFEFRQDRPTEAPNTILLQTRYYTSARSTDNLSTYALAQTSNGPSQALNLYRWIDQNNFNDPPTTINVSGGNVQSGEVAATPTGAFLAYSATQVTSQGGNSGTFVTPAPAATANFANQVPTLDDHGLGDGGRLYVLSDGSVSLVVYQGVDDPSAVPVQLHFPAGSGTPSAQRPFPGGANAHLLGFAREGASSVFVGIALPDDDAGTTFSLYTGIIPESQLFTFDISSLVKLPSNLLSIGPTSTKPCFAYGNGLITILFPSSISGFDMVIADAATGAIKYTAVGASNLMHSDANILGCGMSAPHGNGTGFTYEVTWIDRADAGQTFLYAPLSCTPP